MAELTLTVPLGLLWQVYERGAPHYSASFVNCRIAQSFIIGCVQSANYVRTELPVRIAHRLRDMQALPYIVVTQEGMAKVYEVCIL